MGVAYHVSATFKDFKGGSSTVSVQNPVGLTKFTTMADAKTFAKGIAKYSRAGLVSYSSGGTEMVGEYPDSFDAATTQLGEHYDLVRQKLVIYYRIKTTGRMLRVSIPAPADNCFSTKGDQTPKTDLVKDVADLIGKVSNYKSSELIAVKGGLTSKLNKVQDFLVKTGV